MPPLILNTKSNKTGIENWLPVGFDQKPGYNQAFIQTFLMYGRRNKKLHLLTAFLNSIFKKLYFKAY